MPATSPATERADSNPVTGGHVQLIVLVLKISFIITAFALLDPSVGVAVLILVAMYDPESPR